MVSKVTLLSNIFKKIDIFEKMALWKSLIHLGFQEASFSKSVTLAKSVTMKIIGTPRKLAIW